MILVLVAALAMAMPDPNRTPGAVLSIDPAQVCTRGFAQSIRHPYDAAWRHFRVEVFHRYAIPHESWSAYTLDHLVPLELGGAPFDVRNVWPQPKAEAARKDVVEERLRALVCERHSLALTTAQAAIARDWTSALSSNTEKH